MASQIGTVVAGKYRILQEIGKGGMSVVYLAMDTHLNKTWALKEVKKIGKSQRDEVVVNSMIAEKEMLTKLSHPSLPRIVDFIEETDRIYVVMDYLEGQSLDKVLNEYGAQPEEMVVEWARQLCDVLDYLHSQKPPIIYRDMKPGNIMLKPDGNVELFDFGIAREYKEENLADTKVLGTKGYASPEHFGGRQTDPRSDIYTLGMTMHHLVTGVDPRTDGYEYHSARQYNAEISEGFAAIIDKCVELDPDARYQNCGELLYDLQFPDEVLADVKRKQRRKLSLFIVSAALCLIMLIAGIVLQVMSSNENSKNYDNLIATGNAADCLEAIDLAPEDLRAYYSLLECYSDEAELTEGAFGKEEDSAFASKFNVNKESFDKTSEDYLDLLYEAGELYYYQYTGEDDSFRSRTLKAYPYFSEIVSIVEESGISYKNYDKANSYYLLCGFYKDFVVNTAGVKEPTAEKFESFISALNSCLTYADSLDGETSANTKLTMYASISDILNEYVNSMALLDIDKEEVLTVLNTVKTKTTSITVTRDESKELKASIIANCSSYEENIDRAYENAAQERG